LETSVSLYKRQLEFSGLMSEEKVSARETYFAQKNELPPTCLAFRALQCPTCKCCYVYVNRGVALPVNPKNQTPRSAAANATCGRVAVDCVNLCECE